ncbi:hypothetical protein QAD02_007188 [Eretmocerus hayati]|uniref:Uncharacterized protein n=1 Tax=Eretmocerus hayati TaxID=131215 RepID=A0ACC2N3B0_9HYME|nr:hypothetical protein QAD02_007188 [Eretmocerus hayati]
MASGDEGLPPLPRLQNLTTPEDQLDTLRVWVTWVGVMASRRKFFTSGGQPTTSPTSAPPAFSTPDSESNAAPKPCNPPPASPARSDGAASSVAAQVAAME